MPKIQFKSHTELLSPELIAALGEVNSRVYATVWNQMNIQGSTEILARDEEISMRSKVTLSSLEAAQAELVRAGLLHIVPPIAPGGETKYIYAEPSE